MSTRGDLSAFPRPAHVIDEPPSEGLTKRELIAAMAMQGFLACSGKGRTSVDTAELSVLYADALIKELDKPRT